MTPYRQPILPGESGLDVRAVKRALIKMGVTGSKYLVPSSGTAGNYFVSCIRSVQHAHGYHVDGIYGPRTHAIIATFFDAYGVSLYRRAKIRTHPVYLNPFAKSTSLVVGRVDQGVDYHGTGPICAIGNAKIIGLGGAGWPGGQYLLYQLLDGPQKGHYIYVAEAVIPRVKAGETVRAGDVICTFGPGAATGFFPGIETGWGSATVNRTRASELGDTGGAGHSDSPAGMAFCRWLRAIGAPAPYAGAGPLYV